MNEQNMDILTDLAVEAAKVGVHVDHKGNGHCHLIGKRLVNYWPLSAKKTAHPAGEGPRTDVSLAAAISLALLPAPLGKPAWTHQPTPPESVAVPKLPEYALNQGLDLPKIITWLQMAKEGRPIQSEQQFAYWAAAELLAGAKPERMTGTLPGGVPPWETL